MPLKVKRLIPSHGISMNFVKNYQNACFTEHLYVVASGILKLHVLEEKVTCWKL